MSSGKKTTTDQKTTQQNTVDPRQLAMFENNYRNAQTNASDLRPYSGPLTAGFSPAQIEAQGILGNIGRDTSGQEAIRGALPSLQGILDYRPQEIGAGSLADVDLAPYMNPFQKSVIDAAISDNDRARQIANVGNAQKATAAKAFGGSRSAVLDALTNEAYDRNTGSQIANLNAANFNQARGAAESDINRRISTDQANIDNILRANGMTMDAAGRIVDLNQAALGDATTRAGLLAGVGDAQQSQQQGEYDRAHEEFLRQQGLGAQRQGILNSSLGLIPIQQTATSNSSGTSKTTTSPGLTDILTSLGSLAQGASRMSDGRTKTDVRTLRHDAKGRRWVSFRYLWDNPGTVHEGVIAQEVLRTDPAAVEMGEDGFYRVNYDMLKDAN